MANSAVPFFLAAKQAEILGLKKLAGTCQVVSSVSGLIHELQRERGLTNVFLASKGERLNQQRIDQIQLSSAAEAALRETLQQHYLATSSGNASARLLSGIANAFQGLDDLALLRDPISNRKVEAAAITKHFCRLIAGLLAVVYEAADSAGDPLISRALIALLNFMQGKEYAGQERAWAAIGFASGHFDEALSELLSDLILAQKRTMEVFTHFTEANYLNAWLELENRPETSEFYRMRSVMEKLKPEDRIDSVISEAWYELATKRINAMHAIELLLNDYLLQTSSQQIELAQQSLTNQKQAIANLPTPSSSVELPPTIVLKDAAQDGHPLPTASIGAGQNYEHTLYDLLKEQADRLNSISEELNEARQALSDRKLVERAKSLLMKNLGLSEEEAHRRIQQRAMDSNLRIAEVSEILIKAAEKAAKSSGNRI